MSPVKKNQVRVHRWGIVEFGKAWQKQEQLFNQNLSYKKQGLNGYHHLILCEHKPVYTLGKSGDLSNLLIDKQKRESLGADLYRINRGGDITFHGPGQLVIYPILDLESIDIGLKEYVYKLEESIIRWLDVTYGIKSGRVSSHTGVWIQPDEAEARKIAAIGIKSSRFITMHGAAVNVSTDLSYFNHMIPCGIQEKGITSIENENGRFVSIEEAANDFVHHFLDQFRLEPFYA
jgi:lipoyl(octanoyl) transferase